MEAKTDIPKDRLLKTLLDDFAIDAKDIELIPVGKNNLCYKASTNDPNVNFFIKVYDDDSLHIKLSPTPLQRSLQAMSELRSQAKIENLTCLYRTVKGNLKASMSHYSMIVEDFMEGKTNDSHDELSAKQLKNLVETLANIHKSTDKIDLEGLRRSRFSTDYENDIKSFFDHAGKKDEKDTPTQIKLKEFLLVGQKHFEHLLDNVKKVSKSIKKTDPKQYVVQADLSPHNVLISGDIAYITDWDNIYLAPVERDLLYLIGNRFDKVIDIYKKNAPNIELRTEVFSYYLYGFQLIKLQERVPKIFFENISEEDNIRDFERIQFHCTKVTKDVEGEIAKVKKAIS